MTSTGFVVANIAHHKDAPTTLHFERLIQTTDDNRPSTGISGYAEVSNTNVVSLSEGSVHADAELRKAWNKGLKATLQVQHFLTGNPENTDLKTAGPTTITVGDTSIVGGPATNCRAINLLGITSHEKVGFHFPAAIATRPSTSIKASPVERKATSMQYLHFSSPSLKLQDTMVDSSNQPIYDSITIVSGSCLFNNNIMDSCDITEGRLDIAPLRFSRPTIYEVEHIARAAPAIADLTCTIMSRNKAAGLTTPLSINLDIPNWHYYKAVEEEVQDGTCSAADALSYLEAVDKRFDQVSAVFETAIRHECLARGEENTVIVVAPKLNVVADYIKSTLRDGTCPNLQTAMQVLDGQEDGIWRQFYDLVPAKERPENFNDLGRLFYVFQVMKSSFRAEGKTKVIDYDFDQSLPAPEEMSICLPPRGLDKVSNQDMNDFLLAAERCEFGPAWSQYQMGSRVNAVAYPDEDDNELSFDASSTVDIRVVSSDIWASTIDGETSDSDDCPESITIFEETSSVPTSEEDDDDDVETVTCRTPRLMGEDLPMVSPASMIFHLPPKSDAVTSAACMLGAREEDLTASIAAQAHQDAMFPSFEAASSFCVGVAGTESQPSSDDELASHGFMLPSSILSRSFWTPSAAARVNEAAPILTDESTSHAAMLHTYVGQPRRTFDMETGLTEDDGVAVDDIASFATMASAPTFACSRDTARKVQCRQPLSKDERLSAAIMMPTSEVTSSQAMVNQDGT